MNKPINRDNIVELGIDRGNYRGEYRGYRIVSDGQGRGGVEILDEEGIVGRAPSVGEAFKMIDRELGPVGPQAA